MKQQLFKGTCSVCGGIGLAPLATVAADWSTKVILRHGNPEVCAEILRRKKCTS